MKDYNTIILSDVEEINSKINFNQLQNKSILITGASGLIGIYFLACLNNLVKKGFIIRIIGVYRTNLPDYLQEVVGTGNFEMYKGDITDFQFCQTIPEVDFIIHAAGYGQPLKFMEEPEKTLKLNTYSTFLLFDKLKKEGHFLFISSSEVYSGLSKSIYNETDIGTTNPMHSRACYIEAKRGGEAICNAYRSKGINASAVRLSHTYGPGTKKGDKRVILNFIEKAMNGKIELMDKGEAMRTYCYISDAVEIMWNILFSCKEPVYNLAGNSKTNIYNLAQTIGHIMNVPIIEPVQIDGVSGAPTEVNLDMTLATNEFKKNTFITLEEGLNKTINWYRNI